jgi:hypothetical protein
MQNSMKISCNIASSDWAIPLGLEIWLDNVCVLNLEHVVHPQVFETICGDNNSEHELRFVLKNKLPEHTTVSPQGEIVKDAVLYIKDIKFDDLALGKILSDQATYTHDFNGTGTMTQDRFFDEMGCNGTVRFEFSTPIYLWFLENM